MSLIEILRDVAIGYVAFSLTITLFILRSLYAEVTRPDIEVKTEAKREGYTEGFNYARKLYTRE